MKYLGLIAGFLSASAIFAAVITYTLGYADGGKQDTIDWKSIKIDTNDKPPFPEFDDDDSDHCRSVVQDFYQSAYDSW